MVRVIIERRCRPGKDAEMENLLIEFRTTAMQRSGYVSGETLKRLDDPSSWLVISTWVDVEHWNQWQASPKRQQITKKIEPLLAEPEKIAICSFVRKGSGKSAHKSDR